MIDTVLVIVTVISLASAAMMGIILWRVLELERRRSGDRAADLAAAADGWNIGPEVDEPAPARAEPPRPDPASGSREPAWTANRRPPVESRRAHAPKPTEPLWTDLVIERTAALPKRAADDDVAAAHLFEADERAEGSGRRLVAGFALAAMFLLLAGAVVVSLSTHAGSAQAASAAGPAPLELLSLDHTRSGGHLAIRGVVRNPATGGETRDLVAVLFLFDREGQYLGTLKQPVAETVLSPGAASPFEISVADGLPVGRYRLTFQAGRAVMPHVDRRLVPASPGASGRAAMVSATAVR